MIWTFSVDPILWGGIRRATADRLWCGGSCLLTLRRRWVLDAARTGRALTVSPTPHRHSSATSHAIAANPWLGGLSFPASPGRRRAGNSMLWWAVGAPAGRRRRFAVFQNWTCAGGGEGGCPEKGFQAWDGRLPSYLLRYPRMPRPHLGFFFLGFLNFSGLAEPSLSREKTPFGRRSVAASSPSCLHCLRPCPELWSLSVRPPAPLC